MKARQQKLNLNRRSSDSSLASSVGRRRVVAARKSKFKGFEVASHLATISSSLVAALALGFGGYQFYETQKLQQAALDQERQGKAAEFYQRFVELSILPPPKGAKDERDEERFVRAQRALTTLNAVHLATKGDNKWDEIVYWSLHHYWAIRWAVSEKKVTCRALTDDFRKLVEELSTDSKPNICHDVDDEQ